MLLPMRATLAAPFGIRPASAADSAFCGELGAQAFGVFDPNARAHTLRLVAGSGAVTLVAVRGTERLGFVVVEPGQQGDAFIQAIAVAKFARGHGTGKRLLEAAKSVAKQRGARRLRLCTASANLEALELFLKAGFVIERRMPKFYARGQDACALSLAM
jgi:ribosomal protein S18 acetylase RimI-like enzyme